MQVLVDEIQRLGLLGRMAEFIGPVVAGVFVRRIFRWEPGGGMGFQALAAANVR